MKVQQTPIEARRIPFPFPDDMNPVWKPADPEWSHLMNGISLTMPYLEPFLIDSMSDAVKAAPSPEMRKAAAAFNAQEAQHYKTHREYNEVLKNHYPELERVEDEMRRGYDRIRKRGLAYRMAYTAGFETMTLGLVRWWFRDRVKLFGGGADTRLTSFFLWHITEEAEHKRVAFGAYKEIKGGNILRAFGIFYGSLHVIYYMRRAAILMLKKDGLWWNPRVRVRFWIRLTRFLTNLAPMMIKASMPWHDPNHIPDPQWVTDWIAAYPKFRDAEGDDEYARIPWLDTSADMPPPQKPAPAE